MKQIQIDGFQRITKKQAEKRFNDGLFVRFVPVKYRPDNCMGAYLDITKACFAPKNENTFLEADKFAFLYLIDYFALEHKSRYLAYYKELE